MKTIITVLLLIVCQVAYAQTGLLMKRYYITGSLAIGNDSRSFSDSSAWLQVGADTTNKGVLFPKVLLDSVSTSAKGLFVYDLKDSVLYHFDGNERVRYMTYKDSLFVKELIANNGPDLTTYFKDGGNSLAAAVTIGTNDSNDLQIETNNQTRATVTKGGHLLVNTATDANYQLDVNGTGRVKGMTVDADTAGTALRQPSALANNYLLGNTYFGTGTPLYTDKVYVNGTLRASGNIGASRVYVHPTYNFGGVGQYITADAGAGHFDFHNASGGGFEFRWYQNNALGMTLNENNNLMLGTTVNDIYKLDVNGKMRIKDDAYVEKALIFKNNTQGIQILDGNSIYAFTSILIGRDNGGYPTAPGSRHIKIGNENSTNLTKIWQYVIGQSNNLSSAGSSVFTMGNFNNIQTGETNQYIIGESNTCNYVTTATGRGQFVVGLNNSVLHPYSSIMGNNQQTTGNNQLIFADGNNNTHAGGYRDVYFGSGPSSSLSTGLGAPVTLNSSGAKGIDKQGGLLRLAAGKSTGAATPQDVILATSLAKPSSDSLQTLTDRWFVKGQTGFLSNSSTPTSLLDIAAQAGYSQLRMRTSYTPTSTADANGYVGDMAWDDEYIYLKTSTGWKRTPITTF